MIIGVDFDNTIVCYDELFHRVAVAQKLVPQELGATKEGVRDYIRAHAGEEKWIELQGLVYGKYMVEAAPFEGALQFLSDAAKHVAGVCIISHKTPYSVAGPRFDLHEAARRWLKHHKVESLGILPEKVFFEPTRSDKLSRIASEKCTHFIDDLPEVLTETEFPKSVTKILFDPAGRHEAGPQFLRVGSWGEIGKLLLQ